MRTKLVVAGIALAGVIALGVIVAANAATTTMLGSSLTGNSCASETIFEEFSKNSPLKGQFADHDSGTYVNEEDGGTIAYMYENFERYAGNQLTIDGFESAKEWQVNGQLQLTNERYDGSSALLYKVPENIEDGTITLSKQVSHNLGRWSQSGYITMWVKAADFKGIDSASITFEDNLGNRRTYTPLQNIHSESENTLRNDPDFPDLIYPEGDPKKETWTDFVLAPGWNFLLWRADEYKDSGNTDMSQINRFHVNLQVNDNLAGGQALIFDDLRIQDGLQKSSNPTEGAWYPPHGRPQYGVYDIDKNKEGDYELHLLNIRNTQYPSNGDHARMISSAPVPEDFALRVRFTLTQLGHQDENLKIPTPFPAWTPDELREMPLYDGERDNTYFRVTYDFEPDWDPGHEWFGAYLSLQYNRLGVLSVWPVERNVLQDQEPKAGARTATTEFAPQGETLYEMHILAKGQFASTTIYEVKGEDCLERKAGVSHAFEHPRHGEDKRYPLAIESTGNMRTIVHEVEMISLGQATEGTITRLH